MNFVCERCSFPSFSSSSSVFLNRSIIQLLIVNRQKCNNTYKNQSQAYKEHQSLQYGIIIITDCINLVYSIFTILNWPYDFVIFGFFYTFRFFFLYCDVFSDVDDLK